MKADDKYNRIWKLVKILVGGLDSDYVAEALHIAGFDYSRNRVNAWGRRPGHKNYTRMTAEQLENTLIAIVEMERKEDDGRGGG